MTSLYDEGYDDSEFEDDNEDDFNEVLFGHTTASNGDEKIQQFLKMFQDNQGKSPNHEMKYSGSSSSSNNNFNEMWEKFEKKMKGEVPYSGSSSDQSNQLQQYWEKFEKKIKGESVKLDHDFHNEERKFSSQRPSREIRYVSSGPVDDDDQDEDEYEEDEGEYEDEEDEEDDEDDIDQELLNALNNILPPTSLKEQKYCGYPSTEQKYCGYLTNNSEEKFCGYNLPSSKEQKYCGCNASLPERRPVVTSLEKKFCGCSKQVAQNFAYHVANLPPAQAEKALVAKTNELLNNDEEEVSKFLGEYVKTVTELLENGDAKETTYTTRCSSPTECKTTTNIRVIPKKELAIQAREMEHLHQRMQRQCLLSGNTESQIYDNTLVSYLLHVKTFLKPFDTQNQNYFGKYCYHAIELMKQVNPRIIYGQGDNNCSEIKKYVAKITASLQLKPNVRRACSTPEQMNQYRNDHAHGIAHLADVVEAFRQLTVPQREQFLMDHHVIGKFIPGIQEFSLRDLERNRGPLLQLGYNPWAVDLAGTNTPMNTFKLIQ